MAKQMESHLPEEFKLWSFLVLCQSQSRMQGGKREESNKKLKRTATVGHISSTSWSPFHAYYISFQSLGIQESNASNDVQIRVETKKLWPFEYNCAKLSEMSYENFAGCFATTKPPLGTRVPFRSSTPSFHNYKMGCEMACKNVPWLRNGLQTVNQVANHLQVAESFPSCEITFNLQNQSSNLENGQFNVRNPPVQSQIFATD